MATRSKVRVNLRDISPSRIEAWATEGTPFTASEFWGEPGTNDPGELDEEWAELYRVHKNNSEILYTVGSFGTPIAWRTRKGWVLVAQTWGNRTARHQGICRGLQPMRNGATMWCKGSDARTEAVPAEDRPKSIKGRAGVCPECHEIRRAPNGLVERHPTGSRAQR